MKAFHSFLGFLLFIAACKQQDNVPTAPPTADPSVFTLPAEFEAQEAVWLLWPQLEHKRGYSNEAVIVDIIRSISPYVPVKLVVPNDSALQVAKKMIPDELETPERLNILQFPYQEFWARDMGPVFLRNGKGELAMADFSFTDWGYGDSTMADVKMDEKLDEVIAKHMKIPVVSTDLVSEGGDHEVNGKGTLMIVEAVETQRNPKKTKAQIEAEFKRVLGVKHIIWLKEGVYEDEHTFDGPIKGPNNEPVYTVFTTNGHIDEFARFVDANTILLAQVDEEERNDPIGQENHRRMEVNYNLLKNAVDQDGKPFKIIRMSLPKPIIEPMSAGDSVYDYISELEYLDGSKFPVGKPVKTIAAASYLNFFITNQVILAPKYYHEGGDPRVKALDEKAKASLEQAFPGRKVIMIDALSVNWGGGGIHCITKQEPKRKV